MSEITVFKGGRVEKCMVGLKLRNWTKEELSVNEKIFFNL